MTGHYKQSLKGYDLAPHEHKSYKKMPFSQCWALASLAQAQYFSWTEEIDYPGLCKIATTCKPPDFSTPQIDGIYLYQCAGKSIFLAKYTKNRDL